MPYQPPARAPARAFNLGQKKPEMATALISTSLVLGLGFGVSSLSIRGATPKDSNLDDRMSPSQASQLLEDVSALSKSPEQAWRKKLGSSFKQLYSVRKALPAIAKEDKQVAEKLRNNLKNVVNGIQERALEQRNISMILNDDDAESDIALHEQVADLSSALLAPDPEQYGATREQEEDAFNLDVENAVESANQQPAPPPAQPTSPRRR